MDMKKILQAFDGAASKPVQGASDMKKFMSIIRENANPYTSVEENVITSFEEGSVGGDANSFLIAADNINDMVMGEVDKIKINADPKLLKDLMNKFNEFMSAYHSVGKEILQPDMINDLPGDAISTDHSDIGESTGVTDYNPKSQGGTRKELLAKYHKTKDPKDAAAARKAGATQKELQGVEEEYDPSYDPEYRGYQKPERNVDWDIEAERNKPEEPKSTSTVVIKDNDGNVVFKFPTTGGYWGDLKHAASKGFDIENGDYQVNWVKESVANVAAEGLSFKDYFNLSEAKKDPCWKDYKQVGTKNKNGKQVPNCVPKK